MAAKAQKLSAFDRALISIAPRWGLNRLRARMTAQALARHYEAAQPGRRTDGWRRSFADANAANRGALPIVRAHARDLVRNNSWGRRGLRVISNNTVGWGIRPKAIGAGAKGLGDLWQRWAETKECDADGRLNFYGIQGAVSRAIAQDGEVLIRKRTRYPSDGMTIPLQLQVLEADFLDPLKDNINGQAGGPIIQGVEFDKLGRRVAYWLFPHHPGSNRLETIVSKRVPAEDVIHVFYLERPGQVRGISWFSPVIINLKDFDEFEDASLMKQKIAACMAGFITDINGMPDDPVGEQSKTDPALTTFEPGMIQTLTPGQDITFNNPPSSTDDGFSVRSLRRAAAGLGVTYEDMTGDYSQVNFSSARMARLAHWASVEDWRWNMIVPGMCDPVWYWAMEAAAVIGLVDDAALPTATWTAPPMPMIEPDKEGLAIQRLVRTGAKTFTQMVSEQGEDPETFFEQYAADLKKLDALGIVLDSDARKVSQAGLEQQGGAGGAPAPAAEK